MRSGAGPVHCASDRRSRGTRAKTAALESVCAREADWKGRFSGIGLPVCFGCYFSCMT
jgi:hypothetical protein